MPNDNAQPPPYWKLLPEEATPPEEICSCPDAPPLKLMTSFSANPIHCMTCNREFPLSRIELSERLFEKIYFWHQVYRSVYYLWLDSSEYETWATQQLENPYSYANQKGLKLLPELNAHGKFFFLLFSRVHDEDWVVPTHCPLCQRSLERLPNLGTTTDLACGNCHIVMQSD